MASGKSKTRTQEVREHGDWALGSKGRRVNSACLRPRENHAGCVKISAPPTFTGGDQKWHSTKRAKNQPIQPLCRAGPAYAACELTSLGVNAEAGMESCRGCYERRSGTQSGAVFRVDLPWQCSGR